jgi:hypothetical protein
MDRISKAIATASNFLDVHAEITELPKALYGILRSENHSVLAKVKHLRSLQHNTQPVNGLDIGGGCTDMVSSTRKHALMIGSQRLQCLLPCCSILIDNQLIGTPS